MSRSSAAAAGMLCLCLLGPARTAAAHLLAPALLEVEERRDGVVDVRFKTSLYRTGGAGGALRPILPEDCVPVREAVGRRLAAAWVEDLSIDCGPAGLVGRTFGVAGLAANGIDALLRVELADGRHLGRVLRAGATRVRVPERPSRLGLVGSYAALGIRHIATGPDHLLFVLGLVLLVGVIRELLATLTAFTLGHSVTLSLAALGFVSFPTRLAEFAIAASVLVLAVRLGNPASSRKAPRGSKGALSPTFAMAAAFGLLHGLGFAGALAEIGLPEGEIPIALVSFNCGIEAGQVAFVGAILAARAVASRLRIAPARRARVLAVYAMGALAASWCIERGVVLLR